MIDNTNTYIIIFSSIGLLIIASVWVLLSDWFKQKRSNLVQKIRVESLNFKDLSTFEIMLTVLKKIGCKPTVYEDELLSVQYQGENFYMEFGGRYARIWNLGWALIKADDPDLPNIHEAVNATNSNFGPNVILNTSEKEGIIEFNSKWDIMLHSACPNNDYYVKAVLDSFFRTKDEVYRNIQQINAQQIEKQKNRRPVGFTTNLNSNE